MTPFIEEVCKAHAVFTAYQRAKRTSFELRNATGLNLAEVYEWAELLQLKLEEPGRKTRQFPFLQELTFSNLYGKVP